MQGFRMTDQDQFSLGVEEEFLLVDAENRRLRPQAEEVLGDARNHVGEKVQLDHEFKQSQLESGTAVCHTLDELSHEITRLRGALTAAPAQVGAGIAASGTHPFSHFSEEGGAVTPDESYVGLERDYQRLAREKIICGCHIHVGIDDPEAAIQVLDRVRPWCPTILALSVNSPSGWEKTPATAASGPISGVGGRRRAHPSRLAPELSTSGWSAYSSRPAASMTRRGSIGTSVHPSNTPPSSSASPTCV